MYETKGNTARAYANVPVERAPQQQPRTQIARAPHSQGWNRVSLVGCIVACFAATWMLTTTGASLYNENYQNVKLQTQIQTLSATNASLTAKVDELQRPGRILGIALGPDHMQYANPIQIASSK